MENLMKAIDAFNNSKQFEQREYEERIHCINDGICDAISCGQYETTVYFGETTERLQDKIYTALQDAGYWISSIGNNEVTISWESVEVKNTEEPAAADVDTSMAADTKVTNESPAICDDDYDDYKNYVKIPLGCVRDLIHDSIYYHALANSGVDNWEWYGEAICEFCNEEHAHDMDEVINNYMRSWIEEGIIIG